MARPRPAPIPRSSPPVRTYFRNRCVSCSVGMPGPSSTTDTSTWTPCSRASTRIAAESGEWRAALVSRFKSTCTIRCRSARTRGRSGGRSIRTGFWRPPPKNIFRAVSTRATSSAGSVASESEPVSIWAESIRSAISLRMCSACASMMRKNCCDSAALSPDADSIAVEEHPLMDTSGAVSSWLTMPRNSPRWRSCSSMGVMSCRVTTTEATSSSSEMMGVALTSVVTFLPSGVSRRISSARTVTDSCNTRTRAGYSSGSISRPSARRTVSASSTSMTEVPGLQTSPAMRRVSWFWDTTSPLRASNTTTATGEVLTSASRSALARRSSRYVRALAIAAPAWAVNSASVSSSSSVNAPSPVLSSR